ncbi:FkbM family methyltransferase, partial [bacterium]|nr:FkbM family methyltransferase [bacterium]
MSQGLLRKILEVPLWVLRKLVRVALTVPLISDAACTGFPSIPRSFLDSRGYHSQIGQDYLVDQILLGSTTGGIFVDVGAHDGITFSNTYFFESVRGWTGLCIEPNPEVYDRLTFNRKCQTEQVALGAYEGTVEFTVVNGPDMLSGVKAKLNSRHRQRINSETQALN